MLNQPKHTDHLCATQTHLRRVIGTVMQVNTIYQFVIEITSSLREITCHMGSHSVTCHPAAANFPPLPQPKLVLDLATPDRCKAELTLVYPKTVYLQKKSPISKTGQLCSGMKLARRMLQASAYTAVFVN